MREVLSYVFVSLCLRRDNQKVAYGDEVVVFHEVLLAACEEAKEGEDEGCCAAYCWYDGCWPHRCRCDFKPLLLFYRGRVVRFFDESCM